MLEALLLKLTPLGESDHRVIALTESGELLELIAKNTGAKVSRRRAHLEPLSKVRLSQHHGRTQNYLREIMSIDGFSGLKNSWESLIRAELFIEILLDCLQTGETDANFYELSLNTLKMLEKNPNGLGLEWGLTRLAEEMGHLPNFKECPECHLSLEQATCLSCQKDHHPDVPFAYRKAIEFLRCQNTQGAERLSLSDDQRVALNGVLLTGFSAYWSRTPKSLAWLSNSPIQNVPQRVS